jgi:hypothetical protein
MDDRAPERAHLIERGGEIGDREVGQRERVAGSSTARVDPDGGAAGPGLPSIPLAVAPTLDPVRPARSARRVL